MVDRCEDTDRSRGAGPQGRTVCRCCLSERRGACKIVLCTRIGRGTLESVRFAFKGVLSNGSRSVIRTRVVWGAPGSYFAIGGALVGALACSSSMSPRITQHVVPPDTLCVKGVLAAGSPVAGDLGPSHGCLALDLAANDSTFTDVYTLAVQSGKGYLVTMSAASGSLASQLELATDTSDSMQASTSLLALSTSSVLSPYYPFWYESEPFILLAGAADTAFAIRATTGDNSPADTGGYAIALQTCRMPLPPITDSITHTDALTSADCVLPPSPLDTTGSAQINLYVVRVSAANSQRIISFTSSSPIRVSTTTPGPAAYWQTPWNLATFTDSATATTWHLYGGSGPTTFTVIVATEFLDSPSVYSMTVGSEQPSPAAHVGRRGVDVSASVGQRGVLRSWSGVNQPRGGITSLRVSHVGPDR